MSAPVTMTCMTTKQKFEVVNPPVIVLANGRFAYKVKCPWQGKEGKDLYAFKFCSAEAYSAFKRSKNLPKSPERETQSADKQETPEKNVSNL